MSVATSTAIALAVGAGTTAAGVYAANKTSGSANRSADIQSAAAKQAAELEAQAAQNALDFQKQQALLAQKNFDDARMFNRQVYADQQKRLAPYRAFGQGSLAQLARPIPTAPTTATVMPSNPFAPSGS